MKLVNSTDNYREHFFGADFLTTLIGGRYISL